MLVSASQKSCLLITAVIYASAAYASIRKGEFSEAPPYKDARITGNVGVSGPGGLAIGSGWLQQLQLQ